MFRLRRLDSTEANMLFLLLPSELGASDRRSIVYFVASTMLSRMPLVNSPSSTTTSSPGCGPCATFGVNGRGRKTLRHPEVGVITVQFEVLIPSQEPDQRLVSTAPPIPTARRA